MNDSLSLTALIQLLNAVLVENPQHRIEKAPASPVITGFSTDSRTIQPGNVFIALQGETFDGHQFIEKAQQLGAIAAVVHHDPDQSEQNQSEQNQSGQTHEVTMPLLKVNDTLVAYQTLGRWWRHQFSHPVIAVTGSVGKTTTKELIAAVLSTHGSVLKTQANYNNEIGVPKTLLQIDSTHDYAVIEMGMRGPGEIAELTQVAVPDIGVITNVGTAHIGRLGSKDAIARAKCELLEQLPDQGIAVLNYDNNRLMATANRVWQGTTLTYGLTGGDIHGTMMGSDRVQVTGLTSAPDPEVLDLALPLPGQHNAINYLAALAVAHALKLDWHSFTTAIDVVLPSGRAKTHTLPNDILILDETYNAGVESMTAALKLLAATPGQRHIAVLGTMKELGDWSIDLHRQIGATVQSLGVDRLFILADLDESTALAAGAASVPSVQCASADELLEGLMRDIKPGDRILFKASRSVGLDGVVEAFRHRSSKGMP